MFTAWMKFALATARLGQETQEVMVLRMTKLARGGTQANLEAQRMLTEKGFALAEAASTLAVGGSMAKVVRRYRSHVRANKRRLSRSGGPSQQLRPRPFATSPTLNELALCILEAAPLYWNGY